MKVFLTGGHGMLGRHIHKQLMDLGHIVIAPRSSELDLSDSSKTEAFISELAPDAIVHCAALVGGIQANIQGGGDFLIKNLEIDNSVIFAARDLGVKNFIYIGSSCMYPANRMEPLVPEDILSGPLEPTNANYALAKITGAKAVESLDGVDGRAWKTFISSNLYGPGDHFDPRRSHLLAAIIAKVVEAKEENAASIEMWGDGVVRREFTYVEDFAHWVTSSLNHLQDFPSLINAGCGVDYSVREFYEIVMRELTFKGQLVSNPDKPNGNLRKLMDSSVAMELGWNPQTTIADGILKTHKWYLENR